MSAVEKLEAPTGEARAFFTGYLGGTLERKRRISVSDWNDAVRATREYYPDLVGA